MKKTLKKARYVAIFVTVPDLKTARKIARKALESKQIACANILPKIESHYWWQGKIDKSNELLLIMKTTLSKIKELETTVLSNHPYQTPEFIATKIENGFQDYLDWINNSVGK
ncbi:MAG: divalent-cation tolerance protein CutA [Verrucomicrobiae bacterium]|nr:divalent-cation tolerance protein CutA [Verrucomicrobiae bacterium]